MILEKKREDKKRLANSITNEIKWLVEINPDKTIHVIQNYIQEIQDTLIDALSDDEILQLKFL